MSEEKKYYGMYEISGEEHIEEGEQVKLSFHPVKNQEDQEYQPSPINIALRAYNENVSDEPVDWGTHRDNRVEPIIKKILETFLEYNIPIGRGEGVSSDIKHILERVNISIEKWRKAVEDHLWGSLEESKTMAELHYHFLDSMGVDITKDISID